MVLYIHAQCINSPYCSMRMSVNNVENKYDVVCDKINIGHLC